MLKAKYLWLPIVVGLLMGVTLLRLGDGEGGGLALSDNQTMRQVINPIPPYEVRPNCLEATNNCQVCKLDGKENLIGCSFPGIACAPTSWRCVEQL